ncbi:MAG: hypothetical protein CMJ85_03650 [Planctomycetes bacterium]|nr:hypothetical protein [Planctomycetota bacterium]MDP6424466.1 small multi-drug export protein [Planctomycetota bacterium]
MSLQSHNPFAVTWRERAFVLGLIYGSILAALILGLIFAHERTHELLVLVPSSFFLAGKFLPLLGLHPDIGFSPWELGIVIGIMDTCTALLIVYSLALFYRIPPLARLLGKANTNAHLVLNAYPRIRKFAIAGIVMFVLFPVAGTGAIGGSFIGALLGLHRLRVILAVAAGGFIGGLGMALIGVTSGDAIERYRGHPALLAIVIGAVLVAIWGMNQAYRKALAQAETNCATESPRGNDVKPPETPTLD